MKSLLIILCILLGISCTNTKTYQCPPFNSTAFDRWFPYQQGQVIQFRNTATNQSYSLLIESVDKSAGGQTSSSIITTPSCAQSAMVDSDSLQIFYNAVSYPPSQSLTGHTLSVSMCRSGINASEITVDSIHTNPGLFYTIEHKTNFSLGTGLPAYPRVEILSRDTLHANFSLAYKVYIARDIGIVGYRMYPGDVLWVKE